MSKMSNDEEMLDELKKIRGLLEKPPAPVPPKGLWNEFKDFLSQYKVFGLAVAFIIGLYLGNVVQALVKDLLLPAIGLAIPGLANLATIKYAFPSTTFDASGNPPAGYKGQVFTFGDFLIAVITFLIVALVIFIIVKVVKKWGIQ